jgi:uncharacterized protein YjbI with pentapeptide repeats
MVIVTGSLFLNSFMSAYLQVHVGTLKDYDNLTHMGQIRSKFDLRGANLSKIQLSGANLSTSQLQPLTKEDISRNPWSIGKKGNPTDISSGNFSNAILTSINGQRVNAVGANFSGADFSQSSWKYANFSGADFSHATILLTDFSHANLKGVKGFATINKPQPGTSTFCNATMPSGKICKGDTVDGVDCNCPKS